MDYMTLGSTKERVPRIGLGAWQLSDAWKFNEKEGYEAAKRVIAKALELDMTLIDTAMVYGAGMSERIIGRALEELNAKGQVFIVTKIPPHFLQYHDIFKAVEGSLRRLRRDYVDALLVHWPPAWHNFPTCEYAKALERLVKMGKVRYLGLSNYPVALIEEFRSCLSVTDIQLLEHRYNIVERWAEAEIIPYAELNSLTMLAWSPLAQGAILGKYSLEDVSRLDDVRRGNPLFKPENYRELLKLADLLAEIGKKYDKSPAQVALNFLLMSSNVVLPIPGAKNERQVEENAGAAGWRLSYDDWRRLDEATRSLKLSYIDIPSE